MFCAFASDATLPWKQLRLAEVDRDGPSEAYLNAQSAMTALVAQATTALNSLYKKCEYIYVYVYIYIYIYCIYLNT